MENIVLEKKRVFISYCHRDVNEEWLDKFAKALATKGIECIIDIYDLQLGHDLNYFMEKIKSDETDKVLMLLGKTYKEKADNREGGVGIETQIISGDTYKDVLQEKFIPMLIEKDESGNGYLPIYLENRMYLDFSNDFEFSGNILRLSKDIHKIPHRQKPIVLEPPRSLLETKISGTNVVRYLLDNAESFSDLFSDIVSSMKEFKISNDLFKEQDHEAIWQKIVEMDDIKDIYVIQFDRLMHQNKEINVLDIVDFFEQLLGLTADYMEEGRGYKDKTDHFRFLLMEIVRYSFVILFRYKKYDIVVGLINTTYFIPVDSVDKIDEGYKVGIGQLFFNLRSFERRKQELDLNWISVMANLTVERANIPAANINVNDVIEADINISIISEWYYFKDTYTFAWMPYTSLYRKYRGDDEGFLISKFLISKSRFEIVKVLFNVKNEEEFMSKYSKIESWYVKNKAQLRYSYSSFENIPAIISIAPREKLFSKL